VIVAAQVWAVSLLWSAVGLLGRSGMPGRLTTVVVSIVATHTAVHWMMERGELLAQSGTVTVDHALGLLTLAWTGLILGAGVLDGLLGGRRHGTRQGSLVSAGGESAS
jgi:hypothetical protein